MEPRKVIQRVVALLNLTGTNPLNQKWYSRIQFVAFELSLTYFTAELILSCIYGPKGMQIVQNLTLIPGMYQVILKIGVLGIKRSHLYKLLKDMEQFWINKQHSNKDAKRVQHLLSFLSITTKIITISLLFLGTLNILTPLLSNSRFILDSYYLKTLERPEYEIAFTIEIVIFVSGVPAIGCFDILFVALMVTIICELKILQGRFSNLKITNANVSATSTDYKKLIRLIRHHNFILKCIKTLNDIYSFYLLNVFFLNMLCMCTGLLGLLVSGFTHNIALYCGPYALLNATQLFLYSTGGSYLITESEKISSGVYDCDWWVKPQSKFRKACVLIIQRANKPEQLKASDMFVLDLQTFTSVMKITYSFFTLVQAFYYKTYG